MGRPAVGYVAGSFCEAEGDVTIAGRRGELAAEAVFCGFSTLETAEAYWAEVQGGMALLRLLRCRFQ